MKPTSIDIHTCDSVNSGSWNGSLPCRPCRLSDASRGGQPPMPHAPRRARQRVGVFVCDATQVRARRAPCSQPRSLCRDGGNCRRIEGDDRAAILRQRESITNTAKRGQPMIGRHALATERTQARRTMKRIASPSPQRCDVQIYIYIYIYG